VTLIASQNLEAEESVLGAMLISPAAIDVAADKITGKDFYRESHGIIYDAILDLHMAGRQPDPITLSDHLEKAKKLEVVGGSARIAELAALVPAASNAIHYVEIVKELSGLRRLAYAGMRITELVERRDGDLDNIIAQAEGYMLDATMHNATHRVTPATEGLEELIQRIRDTLKTGTPMTGLLTGYRDIDDRLLGFWPGQVILVAARPSQGKSTLALNIAENVADQNKVALFGSLEMARAELQIKSISRAGRIDGRRLQTGLVSDEEKGRMKGAIEDVRRRESHLFVEDSGSITVQQLAATASRMLRQGGLDLIVVDYIQLMSATGDNRTEEVGRISRGLKRLAMRLGVPILALSQMSRAIESRTDKRPTLSDLRESGALEQDADVVLFLHDESQYDSAKVPDGSIELIIAKNRRGPCDSFHMLYTKKYNRFHDTNLTGGSTQ
jgi:replicative DNA helicase